jgi:hypothetical protein
VQSSGLRNRQTLNAMESPEPNRFTKAPSEYRPHFDLNAITWILSQTVSCARLHHLRCALCPTQAPGCCKGSIPVLLKTDGGQADAVVWFLT